MVRTYVYKALLQLITEHIDDGIDALKFVGFRSKEGVTKLGNFTEAIENSFQMNDYPWRNELRSIKLLPTLDGDKKVAAGNEEGIIIPDFIARLNSRILITEYFNGTVIDTIGKAQYVPLLEYLGCRKANADSIYDCLADIVNENIRDDAFRKGLYQYLSNNQGNVIFPGIGRRMLSLKIFPVRTYEGLQYTKFDDTLYYSKEYSVREGFKILDTSIMGLPLAQSILSQVNTVLKELTSDVISMHYQDNLVNILESGISNESKVTLLQKEYQDSYTLLARCKYTLTGMMAKKEIPLLMSDGTYKTGSMFINTEDDDFEGALIQRLVVDKSCNHLAQFLGLRPIRDVHYSDIDFSIGEITDDDIEDLVPLNNYAELIRSLVDNKYVSEDQISYYHLEYAGVTSSGKEELHDEEFPEQPIWNFNYLHNHIWSEWNYKNPYELKTYTVWRPRTNNSEQKEYVLNTYKSQNNSGYCFCQMCGKIVSAHYIDVRAIEREPVYAWPQMNLCLCLNCSKDFVALRNNDIIWNRFIQNLLDADPRYTRTIEIGDQNKIKFTSTHLAEIQELLKLENYPNDPVKRGKSLNEVRSEEESIEQILRRIEE